MAILSENEQWVNADEAYPYFYYSNKLAKAARDKRTTQLVDLCTRIQKQHPSMFLPLVRHGMRFSATAIAQKIENPRYWEFTGVAIWGNQTKCPLNVAAPVVVSTQGTRRITQAARTLTRGDTSGYQPYTSDWKTARLRAAFTPSNYKNLEPLGAAERGDAGPEKLVILHREYVSDSRVETLSAGQLGLAHVEYHDLNDLDVFGDKFYGHAYGLQVATAEDISTTGVQPDTENRDSMVVFLRYKLSILAAAHCYNESFLRFRAKRATDVCAHVFWEHTPQGTACDIMVRRPDPEELQADTFEGPEEQRIRLLEEVNTQTQLLNQATPMSVLSLVQAQPDEDKPAAGSPNLSVRITSVESELTTTMLRTKLDTTAPQSVLPRTLESGRYMVRGSNDSPNYDRTMRSLQAALNKAPVGWVPKVVQGSKVLTLEAQIQLAVILNLRLLDDETDWALISREANELYESLFRGKNEQMIQAKLGEFLPQQGQVEVLGAVITAVRMRKPLLIMCDSPFGSGKTTTQNQLAYVCSRSYNYYNARPRVRAGSDLPSDKQPNAKYHSTLITCTVNSAADEGARRALTNLNKLGQRDIFGALEVLLRERAKWTAMADTPFSEIQKLEGFEDFLQLRAAFPVRVLSPMWESDPTYSTIPATQLPTLHTLAQQTGHNIVRLSPEWTAALEKYDGAKKDYELVDEIINNCTDDAVIRAQLTEQVPFLTAEDGDEQPFDDFEAGVAGARAGEASLADQGFWGKVLRRALSKYVRATVRLHRVFLEVVQPGQIHVTLDSAHDARIKSVTACAVIIDEASLASDAAVISVVQAAQLPVNGMLLLFGDSKQLTCMIRVQDWVEPVLKPNPTLIDRLTQYQLCPVVHLETVFRGHHQLIQANSVAAYNGLLRAYNDTAVHGATMLPSPGDFEDGVMLSSTLVHQGCESKEGMSIINKKELHIILHMYDYFVATVKEDPTLPWADLTDPASLLIVCFYAAQARALISRLVAHTEHDAAYWATRVITADKAQAREAKVVIISCVRGSPPTDSAQLDADPKKAYGRVGFVAELPRGNVATSRAKCVRIVVANAETMLWSTFFHRFLTVEHMADRIYSYESIQIWGNMLGFWPPEWRPRADLKELVGPDRYPALEEELKAEVLSDIETASSSSDSSAAAREEVVPVVEEVVPVVEPVYRPNEDYSPISNDMAAMALQNAVEPPSPPPEHHDAVEAIPLPPEDAPAQRVEHHMENGNCEN